MERREVAAGVGGVIVLGGLVFASLAVSGGQVKTILSNVGNSATLLSPVWLVVRNTPWNEPAGRPPSDE